MKSRRRRRALQRISPPMRFLTTHANRRVRFYTQNDGFYTQNDGFYTQNDGFYTQNDGFYT